MYAWAPLRCGNYAPNFFGTSVPEVVEVRENPDGSFQYLGNEIRKEDRNNVPEYQYRVKGEIKNGS